MTSNYWIAYTIGFISGFMGILLGMLALAELIPGAGLSGEVRFCPVVFAVAAVLGFISSRAWKVVDEELHKSTYYRND